MSSRKVPRSHSFLQLLERGHVGRQCLAISQLSGPVTAFRIEEVQQTRRTSLVSILTDVTRVLCLLQISRRIKLYHLLIAAQRFIGIANIGENRVATRRLQFLGLGKSVASARDLTRFRLKMGKAKFTKNEALFMPATWV